MYGEAGDDTLEGGAGADTASYAGSDAGVTVDLSANTVIGSGGHAQGDVLIDIENLTGSEHNDILTGDAGANVLRGGAGADMLDGGAGADTASYAESDAGVKVNLSANTVIGSGGHAQGDVLIDIENLIGSEHNDILTGEGDANVLRGGAGADMLDGGVGDDRADYEGSDAGVTVNLATGTGSGGHA